MYRTYCITYIIIYIYIFIYNSRLGRVFTILSEHRNYIIQYMALCTQHCGAFKIIFPASHIDGPLGNIFHGWNVLAARGYWKNKHPFTYTPLPVRYPQKSLMLRAKGKCTLYEKRLIMALFCPESGPDPAPRNPVQCSVQCSVQ